MRDSAYRSLPRTVQEIDHAYGDRIHILGDLLALTLLARLGHPDTHQPDVNRLLERCYETLFQAAVNVVFPRIDAEVPTRMVATVPDAAYRGEMVDPNTRVVLVGVARAGTLPAYQGFHLLNDILLSPGVRVDHVYMQRRTDADGHVVGVDHTGSKFGGDVDGAIVMVPDSMGATGSSMADTVSLVKGLSGTPRAVIALHLIITPEYIRKLHGEHPDVEVFALRLDRGLSSPEVLAARPGERDGEVGTNEVQYIVPGAGGVGEIMNNSYA